MAILLSDEDKQKQQQMGQGAPASGGPADGAQAPGQPAGTSSGQFVNLQNYLDAGSSENRVAGVKKAGESILGDEQNRFNAAADPLRKASSAPKTLLTGEAHGLVDNGNASELRADLNQHYDGPMSVDYSPTDEHRKDFGNLQNQNTIADVVAKDSIKAGTYGMGNRRLDAALYGLDANVGAEQKKQFGSLQDFIKTSGDESTQLGLKAKGFNDANNAANKANRDQLLAYQKQIDDDLNGRVSQANTDDANRRRVYNDEHSKWLNAVEPPTTESSSDSRQNAASGTSATLGPWNSNDWAFKEGTGATRENMATGADEQRFGLLSSLLDDGFTQSPTVHATGGYKGSYADRSAYNPQVPFAGDGGPPTPSGPRRMPPAASQVAGLSDDERRRQDENRRDNK